MRGISWSSNYNITKIWLRFLLKRLLLDDFSEIQVTFQMALFFSTLVDSFLIFTFPRLSLSHLKAIFIIKLRHLVWVLKEIFLQISQLFLYDCFSLVLIDLANCSREAFISSSLAGLWYSTRHYIILYPQSINMHLAIWISVSLYVCVQSTMYIQSPPQLAEYFVNKYPKGNIPYSIANYGDVPYGKVVSGQIGIPQFLQDCVFQEIPVSRKNILLVERGDCTFTQKSINVQKEGGKLAIIMDNIVQQPGSIIMKDDGKGHFVSIPTVLISKQDGLKILQYINNNPVIAVTFQVTPKEKSDVTLWIDVQNHKNFIFLRNFQPYFQKLANNINFNVSYPTTRCKECPSENCFYEGKYCRTPVGFGQVQDGGKQLIKQQLRQYFIFKESIDLWWQYVLKVDNLCYDLATYNICSAKVMNAISGLESNKINKLVVDSFKEQDNSILSLMSEQKYASSIMYYPSIVINKMVYRGNLEAHEVFDAICASINPTPQSCSGEADKQSHVTSWIIFGVISVIVFIIFLVVCFRRIARRQITAQMNKKVNELVNEYISMYQVEKFKGGERQMKNIA